jgi:hypothetical protein
MRHEAPFRDRGRRSLGLVVLGSVRRPGDLTFPAVGEAETSMTPR